jgi:hypothetical protein
MAHLTISLGAPVVVPFRIARGRGRRRRAEAWNARIRWRSFCEAAIVELDRGQIERSHSFHSTDDFRRRCAPGSGKDIWS